MKRTWITTILTVTAICLWSVAVQAQKDIVGTWKTIDDDGVTEKSLVEIWKDGNIYKGKIIDIFEAAKKGNKCTACDEDDPRYNKPLLGMTIIDGMEKVDDNEYDEGDILDPASGSVYSCQMWLDDKGNLVVRGYMGFSLIGRSQVWKRIK